MLFLRNKLNIPFFCVMGTPMRAVGVSERVKSGVHSLLFQIMFTAVTAFASFLLRSCHSTMQAVSYQLQNTGINISSTNHCPSSNTGAIQNFTTPNFCHPVNPKPCYNVYTAHHILYDPQPRIPADSCVDFIARCPLRRAVGYDFFYLPSPSTVDFTRIAFTSPMLLPRHGHNRNQGALVMHARKYTPLALAAACPA
jgi:hypothetical protein